MQLRSRDKDIVFVAGGSGMAPIKSLLKNYFQKVSKKKRGSSMEHVQKMICI